MHRLILIAVGCFVLLRSPVIAQTVKFDNVSEAAGIAAKGPNTAVAIADYDRDGFDDVFVGRTEGALLFRNRGDLTFEDVSTRTGVSANLNCKAAVWGDLNNDGWPELYVTNFGYRNRLYLNRGDGSFDEIAQSAKIDDPGRAIATTFMDFDRDGLLDIFLGNRVDRSVLLRNRGDLTFEDITAATGLFDNGTVLGLTCGDYDNDGLMDIYLVQDGHASNLLFRNNGDGTFIDRTVEAGVKKTGEGMGADFGDYDNDGDLDLYVTYMVDNILYRNNGDGTFTSVTGAAEVGDQGMSWSTFWFDYDNDGFLDIYLVNQSYYYGAIQPNVLYRNLGNSRFANVAREASVASELNGFGGAYGDFNRDGFLDIFVANRTQSRDDRNELFVNQGGSNNWLKIQLEGTTSNRSAYGARVKLVAGDLLRIAEVNCGTGYASQNMAALNFGLGRRTRADEIAVRWPSGMVEVVTDLPANQSLVLREGEGIVTTVHQPDERQEQPARFALQQNYPNPFNPSTTIAFDLPQSGHARLMIHNLLGVKVRTLINQHLSAGRHQTRWDGRNDAGKPVVSGVYFYRLENGAASQVMKLVLAR